MNLLKFQGYSDDTFACEGRGIDVDHDNCASGKPICMKVTAGTEGFIAWGQYAPGPCAGWVVGIAPIEGPDREAMHMPEWPVRITRSGREYSPVMEVTAPDDVVVTLLR